MAIEMRCVECDHPIKVADEHAGRRARCPFCSTVFIAPAATGESPQRISCHYCGADMPADELGKDVYPTCGRCRDSIRENEDDLAAEEKRRASQRQGTLIVSVIVFVIWTLLQLFGR